MQLILRIFCTTDGLEIFDMANSTFQCVIRSKTCDQTCQHKLIYTLPNNKLLKIFFSYCTSVHTYQNFNFLQNIYCL